MKFSVTTLFIYLLNEFEIRILTIFMILMKTWNGSFSTATSHGLGDRGSTAGRSRVKHQEPEACQLPAYIAEVKKALKFASVPS